MKKVAYWVEYSAYRVEPDGLTGERLAAARNEVHLSQQALAAELGVSLRTVQNYESGKFVPYRHLDALSRLLGRSSSWLLCGSEEHDPQQLRARSRQQRLQLQQNVERLVELRDRLVENAGGPDRPEDVPPDH
jgi:transcriptional regulator with XRE-family HTH domain